MRAARAPAAALALAAIAAFGAEPAPDPDSGWVVVSTRPIVVRTRAHPGTQVKEIWAFGLIQAPPDAIQEVLLDGESFPRFMPYVKEVRKIPVATGDGSWFSYQRVAPPLVAGRDTVFRVWTEQTLAPDGSGTFRNRWEAVPGLVPNVPGVVRTLLSSGSWEVRAAKAGVPGSRASYRFLVDPGGNVPSWLVDMGNRSGLAEVFKAVETEARRRAADPRRASARLALQSAPTAPDAVKATSAAAVVAESPDAGSPAAGASAATATAAATTPESPDAGAGIAAQEPPRAREPPPRPAKKRKRARATPASP